MRLFAATQKHGVVSQASALGRLGKMQNRCSWLWSSEILLLAASMSIVALLNNLDIRGIAYFHV